jgi:hypothetical protein
MSGAASRRKGHDWEREVAQRMREVFGEAKRGLSQARGGAEGADVEVPEEAGLWIECKAGKRVNMTAALEQALRAIGTQRVAMPVAICRQDRCDPTATMYLGDWEDLVREWWSLKQQAAHLAQALDETVWRAADQRLPDVRTEELPFEPIVDQPPPRQSDGAAIWPLVVADMHERDRIGRERYGTPLRAGNGRDALVDAYQEALDLCVYLRQAIEERKNSPKSSAAQPDGSKAGLGAENANPANVANATRYLGQTRDCGTCRWSEPHHILTPCRDCSGVDGSGGTAWEAK